MFNFEKLVVWQKSILLADQIYRYTKSFPIDERFALTNQLRRATVSISSNIAEGSSRHSKSDYARFLEIAPGSAFEVVSQVAVARRQGFITEVQHRDIYDAVLEIVRMLSGLRGSLGD